MTSFLLSLSLFLSLFFSHASLRIITRTRPQFGNCNRPISAFTGPLQGSPFFFNETFLAQKIEQPNRNFIYLYSFSVFCFFSPIGILFFREVFATPGSFDRNRIIYGWDYDSNKTFW